MTIPLEQAMAALVEASRGTRPDRAQALRMAGLSAAMREVLDQIAATSLFDTEPAQLTAVLEELADDPARGA